MKISNKNLPKIRFPGFIENWEENNVGELVEIIKSYSYSRNEESEYGTVSHIHYGDIHSKFNNIIDNNSKLPFLKLIEIKDLVLLEKGDIILADASEDYNGLGTTIVNLSDRKNIIGGLHTFVLRPDKEKLYSLYFLNYSKTLIYKKYMQKIGTGASVFGISKANLEKLALLKPSLKEQQKIGDFFMLLDKRIEQQEQKIALLKDYKKAMMQKIFSQKIRFKDDNGNDYPDWEEKKLGKICRVKSSQLTNNVVEEIGKYPVYGANSIVGYTENYEVNKYVSIVKDGAGVGRIAFINNKSSVLGTLQYLIGIEITTEFLYVLLSNVNFKLYQTGTTIPHIYFKDYSKMIIDIPCQLEQEKISSFLFAMDLNLENQEAILNNLKEQKQGLLRKMFV